MEGHRGVIARDSLEKESVLKDAQLLGNSDVQIAGRHAIGGRGGRDGEGLTSPDRGPDAAGKKIASDGQRSRQRQAKGGRIYDNLAEGGGRRRGEGRGVEEMAEVSGGAILKKRSYLKDLGKSQNLLREEQRVLKSRSRKSDIIGKEKKYYRRGGWGARQKAHGKERYRKHIPQRTKKTQDWPKIMKISGKKKKRCGNKEVKKKCVEYCWGPLGESRPC